MSSEVTTDHIPVDLSDLQFSGFTSEKHMCNFIEDNIEFFTDDFLNAEYKSHVREYPIVTGFQRFAARQSSVDFLITTKDDKNYIVEVKNPVHVYSEMIRSVSQLLAYGALAEGRMKVDGLLLVTSNTCAAVQIMIRRYNLPITVVILNKDLMAMWDLEWAEQWHDLV